MTAAQTWRDELAAWALPERITAAVGQSPWAAPVSFFSRRADQATPRGTSYARAARALAPGGTVLDVGSGAGAASLPLASLTTGLTAVDTNPGMLAALRERAEAAGLVAQLVEGSWPAIAGAVPVADLVVCHHVVYNAPDLPAFALALDEHARRRVVVELTPQHPLVALNPLWKTLHGLDRPTGPTAELARAVLAEAGIEATLERGPRPPRPAYPSFEELIASTRRRLCLTPDRDPELVRALADLGVDPADPRELAPPDDALVTLWWDPAIKE